ncbi:MAG TPA: MFS transporter [Gemmatimonadales bacterium]|nr:MFS transporter [Gemmatimonadales bacterium]
MKERLPRQAVLFGWVSLLNDFASEMVYPLLPAFVTGVLGGGAAALGTLDGLADLASALMKFLAGKLADRERRRGPLIVLGYFVAVVVRPVISLTGAAWQVIGLRVTDRIGKGIRTPPRDALIADVTPDHLRGRAFGLQRGMDHAGAVIGPLVAWYLLQFHQAGVRSVIQASAIPGVLVLVLAVWATSRGGRGERGAVRSAAGGGAPVPKTEATTPGSRLPASLFVIAASYLVRMPETLMILRSQELGVPVAEVLLLWAALHVIRSSSSFVGGAMNDRRGSVFTMWLGWVAYVLVSIGFAFASSVTAAWLLFLALGVVAGFTESPERALVARLAGGKSGSGFGNYHALTGMAALAGGIGLGVVYEKIGAGTAFGVSAAGTAVLVMAWSVFALSSRRSEA